VDLTQKFGLNHPEPPKRSKSNAWTLAKTPSLLTNLWNLVLRTRPLWFASAPALGSTLRALCGKWGARCASRPLCGPCKPSWPPKRPNPLNSPRTKDGFCVWSKNAVLKICL
jgi:hypothetical protein